MRWEGLCRCRLHNASKSEEGDEKWPGLSSKSSITRLATTTNTGEPIAVPCTYRYTFPRKDRKVASRHRLNGPTISSTDMSVLSGRDRSLSSLWWATWTARPVGMQVKTDTTSNNTKISSSAKVGVLTNSAKYFGLSYIGASFCPTNGASNAAKTWTGGKWERSQKTQ